MAPNLPEGVEEFPSWFFILVGLFILVLIWGGRVKQALFGSFFGGALAGAAAEAVPLMTAGDEQLMEQLHSLTTM